MLNLAIRGGWLIDGTGVPRIRADVGVQGDRVVQVGRVDQATVEIDASGLIVAPGFVDPHSHSDWTLHANRGAHSTIRQGVTTEVVGNCGIGNAPVGKPSVQTVERRLRAYGYDGPVTWRSFGDYLADVEAGGVTQNLAFLVGHSTIRAAAGVSGPRAEPSAARQMRRYLSEALEAGALGMSSGLEYDLGAEAPTVELTDLARVLGANGGIYASHVRNRDADILASIEEFVSIVRAGKVPGQISHLNVRHDTNAPHRGWERAVEMMETARSGGDDIQADATPFREGIGAMTGLLPAWVLADGYVAAAAMLGDQQMRAKLRHECDRYWRFVHKGQWRRVRLQSSPQFPELNGMNFVSIAKEMGKDPWDCYFDILQSSGLDMGSMIMVGELFTDEHLAEQVAHPLFSLGVDAYTSVDHGPLSEITRSPLPYSGHIRYISHHVRERRTISLEEAIRKMSYLPATRFGLTGRGSVAPGSFADLVVFDFDKLTSASTFTNPAAYPRGIHLVMVNGTVAVDDDRHMGARTGRILRRQASNS